MTRPITKTDVARICRETAKSKDRKLTRDEKQQVFNSVVDGLYQEGRITKKHQQSWTHAF